jgi:hypothetical protein
MNEANVRRIVRDELARAELTKKRRYLLWRNTRSALKLLDPPIDLDQADREKAARLHKSIMALLHCADSDAEAGEIA